LPLRWRTIGEDYVRDIVYAADDGIVTTFAVVAGARGAGLSTRAVVALGFANLAADGLSMAVGNYLGIKSERAVQLRDRFDSMAETIHAMKHGLVTWVSFVVAGLAPLLLFLFVLGPDAFWTSVVAAAAALCAAGALRTLFTLQSPWWGAVEMMFVGALAGGTAFAAGLMAERLLKPS
jgi:vacuolar iron transporter family protein